MLAPRKEDSTQEAMNEDEVYARITKLIFVLNQAIFGRHEIDARSKFALPIFLV